MPFSSRLTADISRRDTLRGLFIGSAAVALPGLLAACSSRSDSGSSANAADAKTLTGGTVTWGKSQEVLALDPVTATTSSTFEITNLIYDTLIRYDEHFDPRPSLAASWQTVSDTEYVFKLRKGVTFSNGRALSTDDVIGSVHRYTDPKLGSSVGQRLGLKSVDAPDASTVRFTLTQPNSIFIALVASLVIQPIKEINDGSVDLSKIPVGTGSFKVQSHTADVEWVLVRNEHAWQRPIIDELVIKIITDTNARVAQLRSGDIDIAELLEADGADLVKGIPHVVPFIQQTTNYYLLQLNSVSNKAFKDIRVRQAIHKAIDRDRIVSVALAGNGRPTSIVSAGFGDKAVPPSIGHDPAGAKKLLAQAGWSKLSFEIIYNGDWDGKIAQVIQEDLAKIGVTVKLTSLDEGVWEKRAWADNPAQMDATVTWYAGFNDPAYTPSFIDTISTPSDAGYYPKDQKLHNLLEKVLAATSDSEKRANLVAYSHYADQLSIEVPLATKNLVLPYRSDKLEPHLVSADGVMDPLVSAVRFARVQ